MGIDYQQLASSALFQKLDMKALTPLLERSECYALADQELLLAPDATNNVLYIIVSGQVSVHLEDVNSVPITFINAGETVGELSVFDGQAPSAYVKATCDTQVLCIDQPLLWEMMDRFPLMANNLLRLLSLRVRQGNEAVNVSQRLQRESEKEANVDPLTQLYNRRWLDQYYTRIKSRLAFAGEMKPLAMLLIDVDHFKQFNDSFGHYLGDVVLREVGKCLSDCIRPEDVAARIGGEEFVLIFPDTQLSEAQQVAERVRVAIETMNLTHKGQNLAGITVSLGIAMMQEKDDFVDLYSAADAALYRAKTTGRNRICVTHREKLTSATNAFINV